MINDPLKQLMMDRSLGEQATMGPSASAQQPTMIGGGFGGGILPKGGNQGPFMPKPAPWAGIDTPIAKPWQGIDQPEAPVLPPPPMWKPPTGQPGIDTQVPPAWKRWDTGRKMIDGYRNNWNPNPIMTRLTENT